VTRKVEKEASKGSRPWERARKGKRPAEPVPTPEEVVEAGTKRKKRAERGKKAATGEEQSAGIARTQRVRVLLVRAVGQLASESNDLGDFEAEADDFEEVLSVETEGVDVCEAVRRLLPANIIATDAMDRLARRERWPPYAMKHRERTSGSSSTVC
jgi:hypothetical protein